MQQLYRHNKMNQRQLLLARVEAEQAVRDLHGILDRPGQKGIHVGRIVSVAAGMGLLRHRPELAGAAR
jgi:hypothetical protein